MAELPDVIVVGSGPSGAIAASTLVRQGLRVLMVDVGNDDAAGRAQVPDRSFPEVRASDATQRAYFLGLEGQGIPKSDVKVGAQLTPPRQFLTTGADQSLPYTSDSFFPMQSLALGGLGAGWGAAAFSFSEAELKRCGIFEPEFSRHYDQVISEIGVSADVSSDARPHLLPGVTETGLQPPLEVDSNARQLLGAYRARREKLNRAGLFFGKSPLAVLSRDLGERRANPYFDMDFWSDSRGSVYRPRYTIEALRRAPGFEYRGGLLAVQFAQVSGGVELKCVEPASGNYVTVTGRRLLLCAGSINSARLALHSLGLENHKAPILCNPYTYIPTINLGMLGKPADDSRHSLAQLCGAYLPEDDREDLLSFQMYSYRSLLLFKLVKELPLPPAAGLMVARLVCNSLAIFGVHHSDSPDASNWLRLGKPTASGLPSLEFHYAPSTELTAKRQRRERGLKKLLLRMGCVPAGPVHPGHAASIHYAGTIPNSETAAPLTSRADGRLHGVDNVWVGDSASWKSLPAKGLTLTIMANAARVATHLAEELRRSEAP